MTKEKMLSASGTDVVIGSCSALLLLSNGLSVFTTASGLILQFFSGMAVMGLVLSLIIQIAKMLSEKQLAAGKAPLTVVIVYLAAFTFSSYFGFIGFCESTYTPRKWSAAVLPVVKTGYQELLFESEAELGNQQQNLSALIGQVLNTAEQEADRQSNDEIDPLSGYGVAMLDKYHRIEGVDADTDPYYLQLRTLLQQVEAGMQAQQLVRIATTLKDEVATAQAAAQTAASQAEQTAANAGSGSGSSAQLDSLRRALNAATDPETRAQLQQAIASLAASSSGGSTLVQQALLQAKTSRAKAELYSLMLADLTLLGSAAQQAAAQAGTQLQQAVQTMREQLLTGTDGAALAQAADLIVVELNHSGTDYAMLNSFSRWTTAYAANAAALERLEQMVSDLQCWESMVQKAGAEGSTELQVWQNQSAFCDRLLGELEAMMASLQYYDANGGQVTDRKAALLCRAAALRQNYLAERGWVVRAITCLFLPNGACLEAWVCLIGASLVDGCGYAANAVAAWYLNHSGAAKRRRLEQLLAEPLTAVKAA